jgi:small conductance mechanosensitive channel
MPLWHRFAVLAGVIVASVIVAKLIDLRMQRKRLEPGAETRYQVLRRSVMTGVVALGVLSGLLVIPQVRAIAGGILASSAVLTLIIGFAAQRTLANFAAGILIAFTQPLRLGDRVVVDGNEGVVEEIGLTYTFIRTDDNRRVVIPNEKLASDTIRNATIRSRETLAQITVQVPLDRDLQAVVDALRREVADERDSQAFVSALDGSATVTLRAWAPDERAAQQLEADLRLRAHAALRAAGVYS